MTSFPSDQALVDGLHAGDRDAFERLYGDYHPAIYNLCARIVGDREEAKDLTQEVFIKAFGSPPAAGASVKLRPWLYRVATNACFNHLRARTWIDGDGMAIDAARAPVDEFERAQTAALVESSLGALNERYRAALVLRDLHGLRAGEIAEVMAVSRPAADVLVHRARAAFKSAYRKLGGDTGAAPANLGLVLAPLSVPAALQTLPSLPLPLGAAPHPSAGAPAGPTPHAVPATPPHAAPLPDLSSSVGPAGAGLLTKIGAALSTKIGITAAAATLAAGGAAVYKAESRDDHRGAATASQHLSDDESEHGGGVVVGSHWEGHGLPVHGHLGHREGDAGTWSWQDGDHAGDGSGTTSHHTSDGAGTSGTTTHDGTTSSPTHDGGTTSSPTHDGGADTSDGHTTE